MTFWIELQIWWDPHPRRLVRCQSSVGGQSSWPKRVTCALCSHRSGWCYKRSFYKIPQTGRLKIVKLFEADVYTEIWNCSTIINGGLWVWTTCWKWCCRHSHPWTSHSIGGSWVAYAKLDFQGRGLQVKIREDKDPEQATSAEQVADMYRAQASQAGKNKGKAVEDEYWMLSSSWIIKCTMEKSFCLDPLEVCRAQ